MGFSEERGDQITVSAAPFRRPESDLEAGGGLGPETLLLISNLVRAVAVLLGLFAFGRFVVKPVLGSLSDSAPAGLPARVAELEAQLASAGGEIAAEGGETRPAIPAGARSDDAVNTIRSWLNQG